MKRATHRLLVAGLLAGLTGLAAAQGAPAPAAGNPPHAGQRMDPAQWHARMAQHHAKHQAELKQKLQLAPNQEAAWASFANATQPPQTPPPRPDRAAFEKLTTPERIDKMRALRTERQAAMDRRADATKAFYATLTPEQKKVFDTETLRQHGHGPHGHGEHGKPMPHPAG